jgi:DNA-nicking Smr family endonuclease
MSDSRFSPMLCKPSTLAMLFLLVGSSMASLHLSAQEIEFATKDGKHKTRGTVASFVNANGNATKLPRSITPDTQVVIKRQDGTTTPPIPISTLSDKTRTAITKFVVRARQGAKGAKTGTDEPTDFFLKNRKQLIELANKHADLGPIHEVDPAETEQYLTELREYRKELGPAANSDWPVRFMLAYFEGEYGENKYGEMYLIAKDTKDFWSAWQTTIIFSLRYRESITACVKVMDQYLAELTQFRKQELLAPNRQQLEKAGHAALWLRETASIVEKSGLASESELKRLKQIQISNTVTTLIKTSEIPDAVLDEAEARRQRIEKERFEAEAEAHRIKKLALDNRIRECRDLLEQFMKSYNKQWEYGREAFDRQQVITNEANQYFQEADQKFREASRRSTEWSIIASRPLGEEPTDAEIRYKHTAEERAEFYQRERNRHYYEMRTRQRTLYMHRQKLAQAHAVLADFVNRGKNQLILFESNYVDTIKADQALKQDYIDFTDKVKAVIGQLPPMPTIIIAPKKDPKADAQAAEQTQREKVSALSSLLSVDIKTFLDQLAAP